MVFILQWWDLGAQERKFKPRNGHKVIWKGF